MSTFKTPSASIQPVFTGVAVLAISSIYPSMMLTFPLVQNVSYSQLVQGHGKVFIPCARDY